MTSCSPPRRFTTSHMTARLAVDPEARQAQEGLINAYEAEEERIINVLSRKLEKLREDKIDLENALEAESENHVNKLSRQLGSMRIEHEELKAKYEALVAATVHGPENGEGSSSSAGPSSNGLERRHRRRKGAFPSSGEKKKKRTAGKSKDTASSNSTSTSNGKLNPKGKEKARSPSRSPPRPEAMSRSSTLTGLNTLLSGSLGVTEPTVDIMLSAMKRENEHLRNRLVDTERDFIKLSRLNEIYREELISHRRRLGLSVDNLKGTAESVSQPNHHRPNSNRNPYDSNMSSPSTSMYHIPTMNGSRNYDPRGQLSNMNGHSVQGSLLHHSTNTGGTNKHASSSSKAHSSHSVQGVPIPRPSGEGHSARRIRPKNIISSEGSTPLSRSPTSDDIGSEEEDEEEEDLFSPGASGSASGAGSISPYPLFSPINSSHMHMAQYSGGYGGRHSTSHAGNGRSGRMRSTSGAEYPSSLTQGGGHQHSYSSSSYNNNHNGYGNYAAGAQPASYASVDTSATSPPSSGGGLGFGGGPGGFAGMMGMRGIGVPSLGAMAANARGGGVGRGGVGNTPMQRGLSYPSVPPPSLSSSLGSVSPSVPLYMHYRERDRERDRDRDRDWDREWGEGSREPSLSPVEPLSRRNSFGGPGGRRGSLGAGGRVAETGSLRSSGGIDSRRASFDYSYSAFATASGFGTSALGLSGISGAGPSVGNGSSGGINLGAATGERIPTHSSGARVAETGSLLRSGGASGRSRAGSLTLSSGGAGYTAGYGYILPETVDEGEGGEDGFGGVVGAGGSVGVGDGVEIASGSGKKNNANRRKNSGDGDAKLQLEDEVVGGLELEPVSVSKKASNS